MIYDVVLLPGVWRSDAVTRMFFFRLFTRRLLQNTECGSPCGRRVLVARGLCAEACVCVGPKLLSSLPRLPSVNRQFVVCCLGLCVPPWFVNKFICVDFRFRALRAPPGPGGAAVGVGTGRFQQAQALPLLLLLAQVPNAWSFVLPESWGSHCRPGLSGLWGQRGSPAGQAGYGRSRRCPQHRWPPAAWPGVAAKRGDTGRCQPSVSLRSCEQGPLGA